MKTFEDMLKMCAIQGELEEKFKERQRDYKLQKGRKEKEKARVLKQEEIRP